MSNEMTKPITMELSVPDATINGLDSLSAFGMEVQKMESQFRRTIAIATLMEELHKMLTPEVMKPIMALQNSPIGFVTDRRDGGYDLQTVTDCVIQATVNGLSLVDNEFNILAGRFYITKNGLKHKLRDVKGLYKNVTPGVPKMVGDKGAIVTMHIEWTINGKSNSKDIDFAVRVNSGMGADAIIGKATRKAYAWLYEEVTGNTVDDGDVDEVGSFIDTPVVNTQKPTLADKAKAAQDKVEA